MGLIRELCIGYKRVMSMMTADMTMSCAEWTQYNCDLMLEYELYACHNLCNVFVDSCKWNILT